MVELDSAHGNLSGYPQIIKHFGALVPIGKTSHFFDFNNNLLKHGGMEAYGDYNVKVTFEVNMWEAGSDKKGYITGDFTDDGFGNWQIIPMKQAEEGSSTYYFDTYLCRNQSGRYYFLSDSTWTSQEYINGWQQDRTYNISTSDTWMKIAKKFGEE